MKRILLWLLVSLLLAGCEFPVFDNPADEKSSAYIGPNGVPAPVEDFAISVFTDSFLLQWSSPKKPNNANQHFTSILVRRSDRFPESAEDGDIVYSGKEENHPVINYTDTDLEMGKTYYYAVFASYDADHVSPATRDSAALEYVSLSYSADNADGGIVPDVQLGSIYDFFTISENSGGLYKDGYRFYAWKKEFVDGSSVFYFPGDSISLDGNTELSAVWENYISSFIAGGDNTFFLMSDGYLWGIGQNQYNQINPTETDSYVVPVLVSEDVKSVSPGGAHTLVLKNTGEVYGFGRNFDSSMGENYQADSPETSLIIDDVKMISAGYSHSLFLKNDGSLWGCGSNIYGQLAYPEIIIEIGEPVLIFGDVVSIDAGFDHSIVIDSNNNLWGCGRNSLRQVNPVSTVDQYEWILMRENVKAASAGTVNTLVLDQDDSLWSFGVINYSNITSMATGVSELVKIADKVKAMNAGHYHNVFLTKGNELWSYGYNYYGQLGTGTIGSEIDPVKIMDDVSNAQTGFTHTIVIDVDGVLWSCGLNDSGQLGYGYSNNGGTGTLSELKLNLEPLYNRF